MNNSRVGSLTPGHIKVAHYCFKSGLAPDFLVVLDKVLSSSEPLSVKPAELNWQKLFISNTPSNAGCLRTAIRTYHYPHTVINIKRANGMSKW